MLDHAILEKQQHYCNMAGKSIPKDGGLLLENINIVKMQVFNMINYLM
jgi:hypothetical protein